MAFGRRDNSTESKKTKKCSKKESYMLWKGLQSMALAGAPGLNICMSAMGLMMLSPTVLNMSCWKF